MCACTLLESVYVERCATRSAQKKTSFPQIGRKLQGATAESISKDAMDQSGVFLCLFCICSKIKLVSDVMRPANYISPSFGAH